MKRFLLFSFIIIVLSPFVLLPGEMTFKKLGEWGSGDYNHVVLKGEYAYCAASGGGLDIIDISNPASPIKVGNYETPGNALRVYVRGDYAYVADYQGGLQIIDISEPSKPVSVLPPNFVQFGEDTKDVCVRRDYAYVADSSRGLLIIDVSNPSTPFLKGKFDDFPSASVVFERDGYAYVGYLNIIRVIDVSNPAAPIMVGYYDMSGSYYYLENIYVTGNDAYVSCTNVYASAFFGSLVILDVSSPFVPVLVGKYPTAAQSSKYVNVNGNFAYLANGGGGVDIVNISNPASPSKTGSFDTPGTANCAAADGNHLYIADGERGLRALDISTPSAPVSKGIYNASGSIRGMFINGNYAYITKGFDSFNILDISKLDSPTLVGECELPFKPKKLYVEGRYAYVAYGELPPNEYYNFVGGILVLDISDPASPVLAATIETGDSTSDVYAGGNYLYAAGMNQGLYVLDISDLSNPKTISQFGNYGSVFSLHIQGKHAYALGMDFYLDNILMVFDISNPASLPLPGYLYGGDYSNFNSLIDVFSKGDYAYVAGYTGLHIVDVSDPASPSPSGHYKDIEALGVYVEGEHAYTATRDHGLSVIDVSNPTLPYLEGNYNEPGDGSDVFAKAPYIYLATGTAGKLIILEQSFSDQSPQVLLDRTNMRFNVTNAGIASGAQSFIVDNAGDGILNWSVSDDADWLHCSPASGTGSGEVVVSVDPAGLSGNSHNGTVTVSDPNAWNSPQTIVVTLNIYYEGMEGYDPFGQFDTPVDGSVVRGSVPVTGWTLDDIGVQSVQIFREEGDSLIYIGDAVFVEGARPDVALLNPTYPNNYNAGWGYMMFTNFLPNGGNGTFTLHAVATDLEGNQVTLGTRTITCDNANAVKPFGAIDTPMQGDSASGTQFANYGWALTPLPNTIPIDGSTIGVWVDGVLIGNPVYNLYREDIATLFSGYNNSGGAVGYFNLDTTQFANGVHIIHWTVTDDAGNAEGIGSRYFRVLNTAANRTQGTAMTSPPNDFTVDTVEPVGVIRGYEKDAEPGNLCPDGSGNIIIMVRELERLELHLPFPALSADHPGYLVVGDRLMPLPVGSTVDAARGVFSWQTGPGFVGKYHLRFFGKGPRGEMTAKDVMVHIIPKFLD
jgi:hypothetical protein